MSDQFSKSHPCVLLSGVTSGVCPLCLAFLKEGRSSSRLACRDNLQGVRREELGGIRGLDGEANVKLYLKLITSVSDKGFDTARPSEERHRITHLHPIRTMKKGSTYYSRASWSHCSGEFACNGNSCDELKGEEWEIRVERCVLSLRLPRLISKELSTGKHCWVVVSNKLNCWQSGVPEHDPLIDSCQTCSCASLPWVDLLA